MSEDKKPEISEEVRQYFKKQTDERVERQKKIILELTKSKMELESNLDACKKWHNQTVRKYEKWPFNRTIDMDYTLLTILKLIGLGIGIKLFIIL